MASFFAKPDPKQVTKQSKRQIGRSQREMQRERIALEREEKKLLGDIKKAAKRGNKQEAAILAKQLLRVRGQRDRIIGMNAQLGAVKTGLTTMQTTVTMANAVASSNKAMAAANKRLDMPKLQETLNKFQRNVGQMDLNDELMNDALADAFDNDDIEEQADEHVQQVLDELGVELSGKLAHAPTSSPVGAQAEQSVAAKAPVAASAMGT